MTPHNTTSPQSMLLTQHAVEQLITAYFEGETTAQQEQVLRQALASGQYAGQAVDEATFAMGVLRMGITAQPQQPATRRVPLWQWWLGTAAVIAVVAMVGVGLFTRAHTTGSCHAWVNGQLVEDDKAVEQLITADLNSMGQAAQSLDGGISSQLSSLGHALDSD